jgi:hypothetical protein
MKKILFLILVVSSFNSFSQPVINGTYFDDNMTGATGPTVNYTRTGNFSTPERANDSLYTFFTDTCTTTYSGWDNAIECTFNTFVNPDSVNRIVTFTMNSSVAFTMDVCFVTNQYTLWVSTGRLDVQLQILPGKNTYTANYSSQNGWNTGGYKYLYFGMSCYGYMQCPAQGAGTVGKLGIYNISIGVNPTQVTDNEISSGVNVFPVPATDKFTVEVNIAKKANISVVLTDLTGVLVSSIIKEDVSSVNENISTAGLARGAYILKVSADGTLLKSEIIPVQ